MLCHERKRMKPRDACVWEINPPSPPISPGWLLAALVHKSYFLPEMKSLQHQNNQEAASLSHSIAKKEIIPHQQPTVTARLTSIFGATRTILNREECKTNSVVSIIHLHSTVTCFLIYGFFIQIVIFPVIHVSHFRAPPKLKISGFSWTWKDFSLY